MKAHFECRATMLRLLPAVVATIACAHSAIAQSPAELIPPAPEYATGNSTLGYGAAGQPLMIQSSPVQNSAQNVMGYRVFIPTDNATIFEQAKAIEPTAFVQTIAGQRVIQVGLFGTEALALQQVARFQAQGMPVRLQPSNQMATSPIVNPAPIANPAPIVTAPTSYSPSQSSQVVNTVSPGYYVVIPTMSGDVNYVQSQLNQLGIPPQYLFLRDRPFGLHYAIGTFSKRSEADRLTAIVRERTKFDARLYHER